MSQRVAVIALGAVLTGLLVGVVIASSGGDDGGSKSTDTNPPDLTVPGSSAGTLTDTKTTKKKDETGTTGDSGTDSGSDQTGGAAPAPSNPDTGGAAPSQPQDTPQNDTQPPADSPAQKFEQFCNDNPSAC